MSTVVNNQTLLSLAEKRKEEQTKILNLVIPDTDEHLVLKMPKDKQIVDCFSAVADNDMQKMQKMIDVILYDCCEQLQDKKLHKNLGIKAPRDVVPALFSVAQRQYIGKPIMEFIGVFKPDESEIFQTDEVVKTQN